MDLIQILKVMGGSGKEVGAGRKREEQKSGNGKRAGLARKRDAKNFQNQFNCVN